ATARTHAMQSSSISTPPGAITRRSASIVRTVPPRIAITLMRAPGRPRPWPRGAGGAGRETSREQARLAAVGLGEQAGIHELLDRRQVRPPDRLESRVDRPGDVVTVDPEEALLLGELALGERDLDLVLLEFFVELEAEIGAVVLDGQPRAQLRVPGVHLPALDGR